MRAPQLVYTATACAALRATAVRRLRPTRRLINMRGLDAFAAAADASWTRALNADPESKQHEPNKSSRRVKQPTRHSKRVRRPNLYWKRRRAKRSANPMLRILLADLAFSVLRTVEIPKKRVRSTKGRSKSLLRPRTREGPVSMKSRKLKRRSVKISKMLSRVGFQWEKQQE